MNYDFDRIIDRRNTGCLKWDVAEGELPMWVADMDFAAPPAVLDALQKRVEHGVFGYAIIPDEWATSICGFWQRRHNFMIERDWLVFATGVIPILSSCVRKLTTPNENVLIQTPVYNMFYNCIVNNGRRVLESQLVYEGGRYHIDFEDLEAKLSDPQTSLMFLCNPQNPTGNIWSAEELGRIGELCAKHGVTVISDEIHCELVDPGLAYVPFASVSDTCRDVSITCVSPTKTFNLAGVQTAAAIVPNKHLRHKVWRGLNTDEVGEPNAFAMDATIAAFTGCDGWLEQLREYIFENKQAVAAFVEGQLPGVKLVESHATYLLWLDISAITDDSSAWAKRLREKTGLFVSDGKAYGPGGEGFIRLNIACPRALLLDGLRRLKSMVEN